MRLYNILYAFHSHLWNQTQHKNNNSPKKKKKTQHKKEYGCEVFRTRKTTLSFNFRVPFLTFNQFHQSPRQRDTNMGL